MSSQYSVRINIVFDKQKSKPKATFLYGRYRTKNNLSSQESTSKLGPFLHSPLCPFKFNENVHERLHEVLHLRKVLLYYLTAMPNCFLPV